jgi:cyclopropane fatty-acyl-phospholipid synthase-like methyltransferase
MDPYQITFQTWNKVASLYQQKFMDLHLYDDTYDRFCQLVEKPGARVFEIGCGPGNITRYLLAKRPDFRVEAIDVAPNMIALARENVPTARFRVMDCRELYQVAGPFDALMCGFCLPYLSMEHSAQLFTDGARLLATGSIAYFSTIEGDYSQSGYEAASTGDQSYVYYYRQDDLQQLLTATGFQPLEWMRKQYQKGNGVPTTELIVIARKK